MPHLRIRSLSESAMKDLSRSLPKELAAVLGTSEDNFTIEKVATTYYRQGEVLSESEADPMVEFLWFDRGDEARKVAAKKVTELVSAYTRSEYIAVVFVALPKNHYFENGEHF